MSLVEAAAIQERDVYAKDERRASFFWERHDKGIVTLSEWSIDHVQQKLAGIGPPPFIFVAIPYRRSFGEAITIEVREGEVPIWGHRVLLTMEPVPNGRQILLEALIFGRGIIVEDGPPVAVKRINGDGSEETVMQPALKQTPNPYDPNHMVYDIVGDTMLVLPDGSRHGFRSYKEAQDAFSL
jgi:hypothetical protein